MARSTTRSRRRSPRRLAGSKLSPSRHRCSSPSHPDSSRRRSGRPRADIGRCDTRSWNNNRRCSGNCRRATRRRICRSCSAARCSSRRRRYSCRPAARTRTGKSTRGIAAPSSTRRRRRRRRRGCGRRRCRLRRDSPRTRNIPRSPRRSAPNPCTAPAGSGRSGTAGRCSTRTRRHRSPPARRSPAAARTRRRRIGRCSTARRRCSGPRPRGSRRRTPRRCTAGPRSSRRSRRRCRRRAGCTGNCRGRSRTSSTPTASGSLRPAPCSPETRGSGRRSTSSRPKALRRQA